MSLRFQVSAAPDAVFAELCVRARAAHPRIQPDDRAFIAHIRLHAADLPADRIDSMRVDDLYLAWASARGDVGAQRQLETLLAQVPAALARIDRSETFAQDVQQQLREKLLVGTGATGPKLMQYAGRGPLAGWIRTAALRTALNMRGGPRDQRLDDRDLANNIDMPDPQFDGSGGARIRLGRGSGIDPSDPKFREAQKACEDTMPMFGRSDSEEEQ